MKVVILRDGQGDRLCEEREFRPEPVIEIGGAAAPDPKEAGDVL